VIQLIRDSWDAVLYVCTTSPAALWPLLLALAGSIVFTQAVKQWIPERWTYRQRRFTAQFVAFLSAVLIVLFTMPTRLVIIAGAIIGVASPVIYFVAVRLIGMKWPFVREWLSQDAVSER